jgi:hypothetical protein
MKKTKDDSEAIARRQWPRLNPENIPFLKGITLNQGNEAHVVDISRGGALIETDVRLRPQMKIVFKVITTQGTFRITGSVLRSSIKSLQGTPIYQSAIVFENPLTMLDDLEPPVVSVDAAAEAEEPVEQVTQAEETPAETDDVKVKTDAGADVVTEIDAEPEFVAAVPQRTEAADTRVKEVYGAETTPAPVAAAPQPVFERPDIFESGVVDKPAPPDSGDLGEDDNPAVKHEDVLVFNVIAPDGLGVSFDTADALNDW